MRLLFSLIFLCALTPYISCFWDWPEDLGTLIITNNNNRYFN